MSNDARFSPSSRTILLPSGRQLGIAEHGDPHGVPIFFFHGFAGSRLQFPPDNEVLMSLRIRLIAVDRPGIGLSERVPHRRLLDWPLDIKALADALEIEQFAILGWSAGGPHALACAYALGERIRVVGLASPMGGWFVGKGATRHISQESRGFATLVHYAPWALNIVLSLLRHRIEHDPERTVTSQVRHLPRPDYETLVQPEIHRMLIETLGEGFRTGTGGLYDDTVAVARPWGFSPSAVSTPAWIWQGEADSTVLPALARELAGSLPHGTLSIFPNEGHFLAFTHWREILQTLADAMHERSA